MVSNFVSSIPGIEYYPIAAMVFFFGFFAALIGWFFLHNRNRLESLALAPLQEGETYSKEHSALSTLN